MTVSRSDIRGLDVIRYAPPGSWGSGKRDGCTWYILHSSGDVLITEQLLSQGRLMHRKVGTAVEYIGQPPGALLQLHSRGGAFFREETWGG